MPAIWRKLFSLRRNQIPLQPLRLRIKTFWGYVGNFCHFAIRSSGVGSEKIGCSPDFSREKFTLFIAFDDLNRCRILSGGRGWDNAGAAMKSVCMEA